MMRYKKGFTLIELLIIISIIAFVTTGAIFMFNNARQKGRDTKRLSDLQQIQKALQLYFNDYNKYPGADNEFLNNDGCFNRFVDMLSLYLSPKYISMVPEGIYGDKNSSYCYWYQNRNIGEGYRIWTAMEDQNLLNNDMDCWIPINISYCIGENWQ